MDPVLKDQLKTAMPTNAPIRVVLTLREDGKTLEPDRVGALAHELLQRAARLTGDSAQIVNILSFLNSATVLGPAQLIATLIKQPEIAGAMAADRSGFELIRPVGSHARRRGRS